MPIATGAAVEDALVGLADEVGAVVEGVLVGLAGEVGAVGEGMPVGGVPVGCTTGTAVGTPASSVEIKCLGG